MTSTGASRDRTATAGQRRSKYLFGASRTLSVQLLAPSRRDQRQRDGALVSDQNRGFGGLAAIGMFLNGSSFGGSTGTSVGVGVSTGFTSNGTSWASSAVSAAAGWSCDSIGAAGVTPTRRGGGGTSRFPKSASS